MKKMDMMTNSTSSTRTQSASIRIDHLPNGLTIATDTMPNVETVTLGVWVGAGTKDESPAVNGISHLVEHMAFKGTKRRSARAIAEEIEAVGGHLNAHTSRDHTAYYAKVLKEDQALALDIIADILQHPELDKEELAREQEVVVQEIGQAQDTPEDIIFDHFQETAFPDQAIGRPVLGRAELVRGFTRDTLTDYLGEHYGPRRMILAAAGKLDHDSIVEMASRHFTSLPNDRPQNVEPSRYVGGEYREERELEQVHLVIGFESVGFDDPDYYAVSVLSSVLGGGMSSRLFQEVREKRGLCYSIYSFASPLSDSGILGVYAGTGEGQVPELIPVVAEEIMKVTARVGADEVARARAQFKAGTLMALESTGARSEQLARQIQIYGRPMPVPELIAKIDAVDEKAVIKAAKRVFASVPTLAAIGPLAHVEDYESVRRRLT